MEKVYIVLEDSVDLYDANAINKKSVNERVQTFEVDNSTTREGHTVTIVETEVRTNP